MERRNLQLSVRLFLLLVAGVALNVWLFRLGFLWGLVGLNCTKHVAIAVLCQRIGVNKRLDGQVAAGGPPESRGRAGIAAEGEGR